MDVLLFGCLNFCRGLVLGVTSDDQGCADWVHVFCVGQSEGLHESSKDHLVHALQHEGS